MIDAVRFLNAILGVLCRINSYSYFIMSSLQLHLPESTLVPRLWESRYFLATLPRTLLASTVKLSLTSLDDVIQT